MLLYLSKRIWRTPQWSFSKREWLNDSLSKLAILQELNRPVEPDEGGNQFPTEVAQVNLELLEFAIIIIGFLIIL